MSAPGVRVDGSEDDPRRPTEEETEKALLRAAEEQDPVLRRYLADDALTAWLPTSRLRSAWRAATRR